MYNIYIFCTYAMHTVFIYNSYDIIKAFDIYYRAMC